MSRRAGVIREAADTLLPSPLEASGVEPRIVMFDARYPPPLVGGKEKQAHLLSCALRDLGVDVRVLTVRYGTGQPDETDGISVTRCPQNVTRFAHILAHLRRWRASKNICHVHTPSRIGVYTGLMARSLGYKVIFKIPDEHLTTRDGPRRHFWSATLRSFDRLVVLDEQTREEYLSVGIDPARIVLGTNGIVMRELRRGWRESRGATQLLFMGRFVDQKGCRELLAAARLLKQHSSDWHLTMVGSGPLEGELRATIDTWALADRVTLLPWQKDVLPVLAQADVLVLPSNHEGMSNVVLEAMSVGVPVVATDVGAAKRLLGEEGGPFTVPRGDVEALTQSILALVKDPSRRETYGEALHARAARLFDMKLIAHEYLRLYQQVLGPGPADRRTSVTS